MYFIIIVNFFCHYNENEVKLSFSDDFFIDFSLRFPSSAPFCSRYSLRRIPKGIFPRAEFSQMLILCPTLHQGTSDNSICCTRTKKREKTPRFSRRRFRASAGLFTKKHTPLFFRPQALRAARDFSPRRARPPGRKRYPHFLRHKREKNNFTRILTEFLLFFGILVLTYGKKESIILLYVK